MDYLMYIIGIILAIPAIFLAICIVLLFSFLKTLFDGTRDSTETDDS